MGKAGERASNYDLRSIDTFEPAALCTAGSAYVRKRCSVGEKRCAGSDAALKTTRGDCLVRVFDIRVEAAKIALTLAATFAQCGHRACLYDFKEVQPRHLAYF